jgi:fimbrial chaperone protein
MSRPAIRLAKTCDVRRSLAAILTWAVIMWGGPAAGRAAAATFTVDPTQIFLSGRTASALLTLRNESQETLRFQLTVFAWDQSPSGEMTLGSTEDILIFPSLLTLGPSETRRVRVGSTTAPGAREKTYRVFVEELPPATPAASGVRVLTKMGIPVFVRPSKELASATLGGLERRQGALHFTVANTGTVHVVPRDIVVRGLAGSTETFAHPLSGWYVLAGGRREFDVTLPETRCSDVTAISVAVEFGSGRLEERLQTPGGVCAP